tara:strand:+ start:372 stop:593 length:222 start_codon:yes stop_codon:yes gene_type:complete
MAARFCLLLSIMNVQFYYATWQLIQLPASYRKAMMQALRGAHNFDTHWTLRQRNASEVSNDINNAFMMPQIPS